MDQTNNIEQDQETSLTGSRDIIATFFSVIPGIGHLYKGHYGLGILLLIFGTPAAVWVGILLGFATMGLGLLLPVLYWGIVALHAYHLKDRRAHPLDLF